jgi:hypothetical protein
MILWELLEAQKGIIQVNCSVCDEGGYIENGRAWIVDAYRT